MTELSRAEVVVVGAGLSGLTAAAFLAREGFEAVLCEQGAAPGGCVGGFTRQGFSFDGGAQSFEDVQMLFPLLDRLGLLEDLDIERVDYRLRTPTVDCPLSRGAEAIVDAFCRAHPKDADGLRRFFDEVRKVTEAIEAVAGAAHAPRVAEGLSRASAVGRIALGHPGAIATALRARRRSAREVAARCIEDPSLAAFLGTFLYRDATLFHMGTFYYAWQQDYWRPRDGVRRLPERLASLCEDLGVQLRYRAPVAEIMRLHGRVDGIRLTGGDVIGAPLVLAACDQAHLERDLLGLATREPAPVDVSDAFFSLFLGLDLDDDALDELLPEHHTFFVPKLRDCRLDPFDPTAHRGRWIEVSRTSRGSTTLTPPGCSTLTVQTLTRADWADWWGYGPGNGSRSTRYKELKEQVEEELLDSLEALAPGLRQHIRLRIGATPWTYQRYTGNVHGASAGWSWDPRRAAKWLRGSSPLGQLTATRTDLQGLYRCGHWVGDAAGVPGAALSGWRAFKAIRVDSGRRGATLSRRRRS